LPDAASTIGGESKPEILILNTGSSHVMSVNNSQRLPIDKIAYHRQETVIAANNIFNSAVKSLKLHTSLKKVVLMKFPLRANLPPSIKASLSLLFNETITSLWIQSPFRQNIFLGNGSFRKKDVTRTITDLTNSAFNTHVQTDKDEGWITVGSKGLQDKTSSTLLTSEEFSIPTQNRYRYLGN